MQNLRLVKPTYFLGARNVSTNPKDLFQYAIGAVKKFIYGSENPYNSRDLIYEKMMAETKMRPMHRYLAKILFARQKARQKYVKHNERIRNLENKIDGGVTKMKSFANRF